MTEGDLQSENFVSFTSDQLALTSNVINIFNCGAVALIFAEFNKAIACSFWTSANFVSSFFVNSSSIR